MATQCFLRTTATDIHRGDRSTNLRGTASGWFQQGVSLTRGAGATAGAETATVTGATPGLELNESGYLCEWITPPLDRDATISGTVTLNVWGGENNMSANVSAQVVVERLDHTGAIVSTILDSARNVEMAVVTWPTGAVNNWTATPTSTACNKGDRLRIRLAGNDAVSDTTLMATGFTFFFSYDGTSGVQGDTYVTFTETFGFLTTPSAQTLYLTDTASDVSGANVEREMWTSRGAGVQTDVTNTAAGPTTGIQTTDTAAGTAVEWYTKQLQATTLAGAVQANVRGLESNIAANAGLRAEIATCAADGSSAVVWASSALIPSGGQVSGELTTSELVTSGLLAGDDVAITDGQRLRLRVYVEDARDGLVTGYTVTTYYAGTSGGASGDTYITLPVTLTEYVTAAVGIPSLVMAPPIPA